MVKKFNISEKDELILLNYWRDEGAYTKVPREMNDKITSQQAADLFSHYSDSGNFQKELEGRIKELENKFEKQKEGSFIYILKREFKEKTAKIIIWIILGFALGFVAKNFI